MNGTMAPLRVKPGMEEQFFALVAATDPGEAASCVYRMDADPSIFYVVAIFESKEAYVANAQRPEADARYRRELEYFDGELEWHDGEIGFALT